MIEPRVTYPGDVKECRGCEEMLSVESYRLDKRGYYSSYCGDCSKAKNRKAYWANREERLEYHREWRAKNHERHQENNRAWREANPMRRRAARYGLTVEQLQDMLDAAAGVCGICADDVGDGLVVDHCHDSGVVRGLLCHPCNVAIGFLGDNPDRIERAAKYLRECGK